MPILSARSEGSTLLAIPDHNPGERGRTDHLFRGGFHVSIGLRFDAVLEGLHVVIRAMVYNYTLQRAQQQRRLLPDSGILLRQGTHVAEFLDLGDLFFGERLRRPPRRVASASTSRAESAVLSVCTGAYIMKTRWPIALPEKLKAPYAQCLSSRRFMFSRELNRPPKALLMVPITIRN